jgi:hypothetical protein
MFRNSLQDIGLDAADGSTLAMTALGQTRRFHDVRCMSGWRVTPEMWVPIAGIALAIIQAFEQGANSCDMNSATMSGASSRPLTGSQRTAKPDKRSA